MMNDNGNFYDSSSWSAENARLKMKDLENEG